MDGIILLVFAALVQSPPVSATTQPIDFYFTNDAVLTHGIADAAAQWTAQCVAGGEFARVAASYAPDTRMSADAREAQAGKFDRREFERLATDAWRRANAALPQGPLRVCIDLAADTDAFTRDVMGGIAGVTAGHGRIILRIHPDANWQAALPYALAHEMHHSYWAQYHFDPKKPFTLADYMVLEGRADYFAGTLFTHPAPWTAALDATAYATAWRALSQQLNATESGALQTAMFGSPQAGIPAWAGYSIGFQLVSERMARAPTLDLKAMTRAPASEFITAPAPK
jgi:hypothetical protein